MYRVFLVLPQLSLACKCGVPSHKPTIPTPHSPPSTNMTATPPLGAYIIRNRYTSTVIHTDDGVTVKSSSRDEEHQRERQIWWIEAIAGPEGDETKVVYRITNIAKDISLAVSGGSCEDKSEVTVHSTHGAPWQLWRFERQLGIAEGYVRGSSNIADTQSLE